MSKTIYLKFVIFGHLKVSGLAFYNILSSYSSLDISSLFPHTNGRWFICSEKSSFSFLTHSFVFLLLINFYILFLAEIITVAPH